MAGGALRLRLGPDRSAPARVSSAATVATLYRCNTPTDWLCPCGKVARALGATGIPFEASRSPQRRSRRPEVEALSGQRRVPLLVLDGEVICDSRRIVEHLEFRRAAAAAAAAAAAEPAQPPQPPKPP